MMMMMKSTYGPALSLIIVFVTGTVRGDRGDLASLPPVYSVANIASYLNQQRVKDDLNLTKQQDIAIQKIVLKSGQKMGQDAETIFKLSGPDKNAKIRALYSARADELFQALGQTLTPGQVKRLKQISLQHWGIVIFDHSEIRNALHLSEAQAANLKAIHKQIQDQLAKEVIAKRTSQREGQKQYMVLTHSIPDSVRAALTEEQRKTLQHLLGQPYSFE
jgi:hypothetical protein